MGFGVRISTFHCMAFRSDRSKVGRASMHGICPDRDQPTLAVLLDFCEHVPDSFQLTLASASYSISLAILLKAQPFLLPQKAQASPIY